MKSIAFLSLLILVSHVHARTWTSADGKTIEAEFIGVRELSLVDATFDEESSMAEITVKYIGELTSVVRDSAGEIIEGSPTQVKRQKDVWTYARRMGADDPNWQLVATGE